MPIFEVTYVLGNNTYTAEVKVDYTSPTRVKTLLEESLGFSVDRVLSWSFLRHA